jgi:hypothetical protein
MLLSTAEEYKEFNGINQSRLKLIENPGLFLNTKKEDYEDGEPEHYKFGTFIDDMLLDLDISSRYIALPDMKLPPKEGAGKVIDQFIKESKPTLNVIDFYKDDLLAKAKSLDVYTTFKEEIAWKKIKEHERYFDHVVAAQDKIVLTNEQLMLGAYYKSLLLTDPMYSKYYVNTEDIENIKKVRIAVDIELFDTVVSLKGELDSLQVDHKNKTYSVVDDKTTAELASFSNSIFKYRYDFQIAFYNFLVENSLKELGIEGYTSTDAKIIAISSSYAVKPLIYNISATESLNTFSRGGKDYIGVFQALIKYIRHRDLNRWDIPVEMIDNGYIEIKYE